MPEFLKLTAPAQARALLLEHVTELADRGEDVATVEALHRVVAQPISAPHPLPQFARSTVDGYALSAADTFGAGSAQPAYLQLAGEVPMGGPAAIAVSPGRCALIHTGGMLPPGADAVIMLEYAQAVGPVQTGSQIEIYKAAPPGENVIQIGEDITAGQVVIQAGHEIRAQDIGGLMALGLLTLRVRAKPRVAIISSGDEVVDPGREPLPGQVRDVNAYCLAALVAEHGGEPIRYGIVPDDAGRLAKAAAEALQLCDLLVITAGSSASARDLTAQTISSLGNPGVLVHGINIRPGKPTILGVCGGKPVIGLPGNPVSAFVVARLMVLPAVAKLDGRKHRGPEPTIRARLAVNLPSQAGREDWWPVKLEADPMGRGRSVAAPVFGRSNLIFNLVSADGLVGIPADANGLAAGELVEVEPI